MSTGISYTAFEFNGSPFDFGAWITLLLISTLLVLPLPFCSVAFIKWLISKIKLNDGSVINFEGTAEEISLVCWAAALCLHLLFFGAYMINIYWLGPVSAAILVIVAGTGEAVLSWFWIRWFVGRIRIRGEIALDFEGELGDYIRLIGLLAASLVSIVGWPWVFCSVFRWICSNIYVQGDRDIVFLGTGSDLFWRSYAAFILSLAVITIPFVSMWVLKWWIRNLGVIDSK